MKAPFSTIAAAVAIVLLFASGVAEPAACEPRMHVSVDLLAGDVPLVPVSIDGKPALMGLIMSSVLSVFYEGQAATFGLPKKPLNAGSEIRYGDRLMDSYVEIGAFGIGGREFGKRIIAVAPGASGTTAGTRPVVGYIGMELFHKMDFELDLARNKLNLFSQDHCKGMGAYWAKEYATAQLYRGRVGEFFFAVEVEGRKIEANIAPNYPRTILHTQLTRAVFDFDQKSPGVVNEGGGDYYKAMKLTAPGLGLAETTNIYLMENGIKDCKLRSFGARSGATGYRDPCVGVYPMKIGLDVLQKLRLYFATSENKVWYTAAGAGSPELPGAVNPQGDAPDHEREQRDDQGSN